MRVHCILMLFAITRDEIKMMQGHAFLNNGIEIEPVSIGFVNIPMIGLCQMVVSAHECEGSIQ